MAVATGCGPSALESSAPAPPLIATPAPAADPWFVNVVAASGIDFVHQRLFLTNAVGKIDPRAITTVEVEQRLHDRGVGDRQFYNGEMHTAMLALPEYIKTLIG